ncbi:unnamed protein product [Phytophthora fragariaefolia]|uniref:Unnamed protein product n=1 Tax=Phytophthora fragariaefolia TaxID=1490495 RepID=A0A9W6Y708_9STRA|nr:unnamed protein product [Phytophthora fragariaefolia]
MEPPTGTGNLAFTTSFRVSNSGSINQLSQPICSFLYSSQATSVRTFDTIKMFLVLCSTATIFTNTVDNRRSDGHIVFARGSGEMPGIGMCRKGISVSSNAARYLASYYLACVRPGATDMINLLRLNIKSLTCGEIAELRQPVRKADSTGMDASGTIPLRTSNQTNAHTTPSSAYHIVAES